MTKGRPATRGVDDAVVIGRKRGCVSKIVYGLESVCDFFIRTAACVVFVKTRRTDKIIATIKEIEHVYQDLIAELRLFPVSAQILLELWIYSKHGTYRFFRISKTGLVELDRDAMLAAQPEMIAAPAVIDVGAGKEGGAQLPSLEGEGEISSPGGVSPS